MHHAKLGKSPRLKRVHKLLSDGQWHSTWEIAHRAKVCAVNSCIAELRANGAEIEVDQRIGGPDLRRVWFYRMTKGARRDGE